MREGSSPEEWRTGLIVPIWNGKRDVQDHGKCRGIMLRSHVMKVLERIMDMEYKEVCGYRRRAAGV